jgi:hypothetical protein
MSTPPASPDRPLDVGGLVSEVIRVFRARFQEVFLISLLYSVISLGVSLALLGPERTFGLGEARDAGGTPGGDGPGAFGPGAVPVDQLGAADVVSAILQLFLGALFVAVIALLVVDDAEGRRAGAASYLQRALPSALPVAVLSIVIGLAVGFGLVLLILPGLWAFAALSVAIPAAAAEGAGLGGLRRSVDLTRGYRWPIVGFGLVFFAIVLALSLALGLVVLAPLGLMIGAGDPGPIGSLVLTLVTAGIGALYSGLGALPAPVLYLRLRALKEWQGR